MAISFGAPEAFVVEQLIAFSSDVDAHEKASHHAEQGDDNLERRVSANGEVELLSNGAIFRLQRNCFVEATFPDHKEDPSYPGVPRRYRAHIDGVAVLSVFDWLSEQPDTVDIARFRVNERLGIAYDYRFPNRGSYTVFAPGHWAGLIA